MPYDPLEEKAETEEFRNQLKKDKEERDAAKEVGAETKTPGPEYPKGYRRYLKATRKATSKSGGRKS